MKLYEELKRRNVFRVAVAYTVVAWVVAQIADLVFNNIGAPAWVMPALFLLLALGFLAALIISWAYEVTPEGLKRERDVVRDASITHVTAKKLDYITIGAVMVAAVMFGLQLNNSSPSSDANVGRQEGQPAAGRLVSGGRSIAVLPFANRSNNDEDLFFTDGIHDDLLTQLAKINDLKVISRTSVMQYRGTEKRIPEIAEELGVATILEGGVQRAGHRIRINAQLIDVATDEHLWAETFDREMTIENLFEIQSEITRQIVTAIRGQLTTEEQQAIVAVPTHNLEAYEAYLRARNILTGSGYNFEKFELAQPYAELAVALDPDFALAHLLLVDIHGQVVWSGFDTTPARRQAAIAALDKSESLLGPDAPEVLAARGEILYRFDADFPAALGALQKAYAAMPGDAQLLEKLSYTYRRVGRWDESVESGLKSIELDPANVSAVSLVAESLTFMGQSDRLKAFLAEHEKEFGNTTEFAAYAALWPIWTVGDVAEARRRFAAVRPNISAAYYTLATELPWYERNYQGVIDVLSTSEMKALASFDVFSEFQDLLLARAYEHLDRSAEATVLLDQVVQNARQVDRDGNALSLAYALSTQAQALALRGDKSQAIAAIDEAKQLVQTENDSFDGNYVNAVSAEVLALVGERDRALDLIAQLIDRPAGFKRWELYLDPRWDFFRDDERFNELIRPRNLEQAKQ